MGFYNNYNEISQVIFKKNNNFYSLDTENYDFFYDQINKDNGNIYWEGLNKIN